ncbi:MAG: hypothetical protein ACJ8OJ_09270 [Povalibacter sp.]
MKSRHTRIALLTAATLCLSALAGCNGDNRSSRMNTPPTSTPPPAPEPAAVNFPTFMRTQVTGPVSEIAEPIDYNSTQFSATDDESETTYDDVLKAAM